MHSEARKKLLVR